jgi:ABC-2 type transport system permease protein
MRTIFYILQKEIIQIRRNKIILPMLFGMPIIQLIILGHAANFEVKNINLFLIDKDQSSLSRQLVSKFTSSDYFNIVNASFNTREGDSQMMKRKADMILEIPTKFEYNLISGEKSPVSLKIDAVNGMKAGIANAYSSMIINAFNSDVLSGLTGKTFVMPVDIRYSYWYNPEMKYSTFMVPGILVLLVTLVGGFISAMIIVREKEIGTIEQLNVTPIKKHELILGKLLTFFFIGFVELSIGLLIGKLIFNLHFEGSIWLVYAFTLVYLPVVLGLGLLISTFTNTQQQAMFLAWFIFMIFILMGGLFTPIESMPVWAQKMTLFNPIRYFIEFMRMVLLKGSTFADVKLHFGVMMIYGIAINLLAIWNYRKTTS